MSLLNAAQLTTDPAAKKMQPRRTYSGADVFPTPQPGYPSGPAQAVGVGAGAVVYLIQGTTMRRTPDLGVHGYGVGVPAGTTASTCLQVYEWNGNVYGIFQDTGDSRYKLYRAPITTGATALTWSAAVLTLNPGSLGFGCVITGTSTSLLVGEYGDPMTTSRVVTDGALTSGSTTITSATAAFTAGDVGSGVIGSGIPFLATITSVTNGTTAVLSAAATSTATGVSLTIGPRATRILRSTDGATFTATRAFDSTIRHVHCVAADPYNDGTVWASFGDNVANCYSVSTDHGQTWTDITCSATWQGVQISFGPDWVYVAPDAVSHAPLFVIDRATRTPRVGSFGDHRTLQVTEEGTYYNGVTTNASTTLSTGVPDFAPVFTGADKGRKIIGAGIPDGTTIATVTNSGTVVLSAAATATANNVAFTIDRNERPKATCFVGAVDPTTGIYYGLANNEISSAPATTYSRLVMFIVPYVGGPVIHLADLNIYGPTMLFDTAGNVWCGHVYRPKIAASYLA